MRGLPENWTICMLNELLVSLESGSRPRGGVQGIQEGIPSIGGEHLTYEGGFNFNSIKFVPQDFASKMSKGHIKRNDMLIVKDGATTGKTAFVGEDFPYAEAVVNEHIFICRTTELISPRFLFRYLISEEGKNRVLKNFQGSAQGGINSSFASNTEVPLAPLNEQHRIVDKLEKLLARVNNCRERLDTIPGLLKRFRQSVLAAACSGRLSADWRRKNPDVEPASELLKRVKVEKEKCYKEKYIGVNNRGKRRSRINVEDSEAINHHDLPDIPNTWNWTSLINISNIQGGVTKGRKLGDRKTINVPYLRVANVQDGYLNLNEIKEIEILPNELEKYKLKAGDLLFTEGGDRDKLGRGTIWQNDIENCIHQNHIFRARLYCSDISSKYISIATKSDYAKTYFFENASQTVNLASINLTSLGGVPLAIPPIKEQQEIVRRVDALFKIAGQIEARYQKARAYVDKLTQSILAKAFRGELAPQDPADEPASILLERIREERARRELESLQKGNNSRRKSPARRRKEG